MSGKQSKATAEAIRLVKEQGLTRYAASKRAGCSLATIYRVMPELNEKEQERKAQQLTPESR